MTISCSFVLSNYLVYCLEMQEHDLMSLPRESMATLYANHLVFDSFIEEYAIFIHSLPNDYSLGAIVHFDLMLN